jgi:hypothetical protein
MGGIGRSIAAVLLGVIAALACVMAGDTLAHFFAIPSHGMMRRVPSGIDANDHAALALSTMPVMALLALVLGWIAAAFVGPWVAVKVARRSPLVHAAIVGALLLTATVTNLASLPHPIWMWVVGILAFPLGVWVVARPKHP